MFEDAKGTVLERFGPESQSHVEKWERDGKEYPFGLLCPPPPAFPPSPASLSYVPLLLPSLIPIATQHRHHIHTHVRSVGARGTG